jgi:cytoskeletal protein CcmA (bactofilin family)
MFKNSGGSQNDLNGFLDRGSRLEGELQFESSFRIDGRFQGKITSSGRLIVGEGGEVGGDIHVRLVTVSGILRGALRADEQIHIAAGGRVEADLDTPSLVIEDGAVFEGRCTMQSEGKRSESKAGDEGGPKLLARAGAIES